MQEALLVVDMQQGFVKPPCERIISPIISLIKHFTAAHRPVAFTQFINPAYSNFEQLMQWQKLRHSAETDIIPVLQPLATNIFVKHQYSAFTPAFEYFLQQHRVQKLYLCGIATESCVLKSAMDAFERGLHPVVVQDAVYSHASDAHHAAGLLVLARNIGETQLVTVSDTLQSLF
ncbi:Nicotinamidase-related amidase [Chitinophaga jiangningensis]|uniref:Nicotinamidase-related amidase n=1 Tax=Chitinophaga jiangningensis TaxID=1419482 RepID=A0A1M7JSP1_9BACT|nr:isochorismatase family cysteine hydrolase [Chitinophaga jiangningensis]SHM56014.1 Nicotinamidase-related amidase [Chitinophaga jiangningensis]